VAPAAAGYWQTPATVFRVGATLGGTALDAGVDDIRLDSAFMPDE
jgi:hypothetical protein